MEVRNPNYQAAVHDIMDAAQFIQDLGIRVVAMEPGWCEMELPLLPKHQQQNGFVHAGVIATLADHAAGAAGTTLLAASEFLLTAEFNMSLLRAARGERLHCRAEVLKPGKRLSVVESSVYVEADGRSTLVAKARVTLAALEQRSAS